MRNDVHCQTVPLSKGADAIKITKPRPVVQRLPLTEARNSLGAVVKRVHLHKEYVHPREGRHPARRRHGHR